MCKEEVICVILNRQKCVVKYEMTPVKSRDTPCDAVEPLIVSKLNFCGQDTIKPVIIVKVAIVYLAF